MRHGGRIRIGTLLAGVACAGALLAGCGGGKDFADKARPAVPAQLTGVITDSSVSVSPNKVGAGPVVIVVSNQTQASHTLTLEGPSIPPVRTGPINPSDTGTIQQTLVTGNYTVKAGSEQASTRQIKPARLIIGRPRQDSNGDVNLP